MNFSPLQSAFWMSKFMSVLCAKYIRPTLTFPKVSNLKFKLASKHHQFKSPKSHLDHLNQQQVKTLGQNSFASMNQWNKTSAGLLLPKCRVGQAYDNSYRHSYSKRKKMEQIEKGVPCPDDFKNLAGQNPLP